MIIDGMNTESRRKYPDLEAYIALHYVEPDFCAGLPDDDCCIALGCSKPKAEDRLAGMSCPEASPCLEDLFIFEHGNALEERMRHLSDSFSEYLFYLIEQKHLENADVWRRAIIDRRVFSKIKNHSDYHPQKMTALCLCIGAMLNLDESRDLLARAGYALSPCDKTDVIFSYFIEHEIYDMIELDIQLEEHGLPALIS